MKKNLFNYQAIGKILLILTISIFTFGCKKENNIPPQSDASQKSDESDAIYKASFRDNTLFSIVPILSIPLGSYDITRSLPSGYVKDGSEDYTSYIQAALDRYSNVTFPAFPILINDDGLSIESDKTLNFLAGSKLLLKPSSKDNYDILRIEHATNVTLNNPVIIGDATEHLGTTGEWGNGISILSSDNITVNGARVSNCWGDGIYIGTSKGTTTNTDIRIANAYLKSNRRDGMSITSAIGLVLESVYAGYSWGTSPRCGINFEPHSSADELQNITLNNPSTGYNGGNGIQIGYSNLYGGSNKKTSIYINNPMDKKSLNAFRTSANISKRAGNEIISGVLNITSPYWRQNEGSAISTDLYDENIKLTITNPAIQNTDGDQLSQDEIYSRMTYKTAINDGANYSILF